MKIAYLDCFSGISGNMMLGALIELGVGEDVLRADLAGLGIEGWELVVKPVHRGALAATLVEVEIGHDHAHRHLYHIHDIINNSTLPDPVKKNAAGIFSSLAHAEAKIHGESVEHVHFHEVGAVDAIVDIVGAAVGLYRLGVEKVYCSPLPVTRGWVKSAHGEIPLPAPAAAALLQDVPTYGVEGDYELVTPTGAAIVKTLAHSFGLQPAMTVNKIGFGAGSADFARPNVLRVFLGEEQSAAAGMNERLTLLETNIDNMNPELFEPLMERLFAAGALDVYFTPIMMKKSRPAIVLSALCNPKDKEPLAQIIFSNSTTLGVRISQIERRCLQREFKEIETPWGKVKIKLARANEQIVSASPEYEDCKRLAAEHDLSVREVYDAAKAIAWQAGIRKSIES